MRNHPGSCGFALALPTPRLRKRRVSGSASTPPCRKLLNQAQRKAFINGLKEEDLAEKPTISELIKGFNRPEESFDNSRAMFAQASWLSPADMLLLAHSHPWVTRNWFGLFGLYRWLRNLYLPHLSASGARREPSCLGSGKSAETALAAVSDGSLLRPSP